MSGPAKVPDYAAIADRLRVEPETAAEDIKNALQLLQTMPYEADQGEVLAAIERRLWSAVVKLEKGSQ